RLLGAAAVLRRAEELGGKLARLRLLQLLERERRVGRQAAAPAGSGVEKLRAREGKQQDREVTEPRGQQLDEVEKAAIGPMHVLEDQHRRPVTGNGLDEPPDREEQR